VAPVLEILDDSSDEEEVMERNEEQEEQEIQNTDEPLAEPKKKPMNSRVFLEIDQLDKVIGQLACRECGQAVKATVGGLGFHPLPLTKAHQKHYITYP
jgi:hypothetical protein